MKEFFLREGAVVTVQGQDAAFLILAADWLTSHPTQRIVRRRIPPQQPLELKGVCIHARSIGTVHTVNRCYPQFTPMRTYMYLPMKVPTKYTQAIRHRAAKAFKLRTSKGRWAGIKDRHRAGGKCGWAFAINQHCGLWIEL